MTTPPGDPLFPPTPPSWWPPDIPWPGAPSASGFDAWSSLGFTPDQVDAAKKMALNFASYTLSQYVSKYHEDQEQKRKEENPSDTT